jgi:hypothetical protein
MRSVGGCGDIRLSRILESIDTRLRIASFSICMPEMNWFAVQAHLPSPSAPSLL